MVDTTEAMESQFLTADLVRSSPTKALVVISQGSYEETDYGKRLTLEVEIDGKMKTWRPNRDSVKNMQIFGVDSSTWVGKKAKLQIVSIQGKDSVIAIALQETVPGA